MAVPVDQDFRDAVSILVLTYGVPANALAKACGCHHEIIRRICYGRKSRARVQKSCTPELLTSADKLLNNCY